MDRVKYVPAACEEDSPPTTREEVAFRAAAEYRGTDWRFDHGDWKKHARREAAHVVKRLDEFERRAKSAQSRALEAMRRVVDEYTPGALVPIEYLAKTLADIEAVKEKDNGL